MRKNDLILLLRAAFLMMLSVVVATVIILQHDLLVANHFVGCCLEPYYNYNWAVGLVISIGVISAVILTCLWVMISRRFLVKSKIYYVTKFEIANHKKEKVKLYFTKGAKTKSLTFRMEPSFWHLYYAGCTHEDSEHEYSFKLTLHMISLNKRLLDDINFSLVVQHNLQRLIDKT